MPRFLLYAILIYCAINLGILLWFWGAMQTHPRLRLLAIPLLTIIAACFPIFFRGNNATTTVDIMLLALGSFWTGLLVYLFLMILGTEILILIKTLLRAFPLVCENIKNFRFNASIVIFSTALLIGLASAWNARSPVLREIELTIPTIHALPEGASDHIVFGALSDVHLGRLISGEYLADALNLLTPHKPQAIFFLGDLLDDHIRVTPEPVKEALLKLAPQLGTWGIMGNHEYISGPIEKSLELFEQSGISPLRDQWTILGNSILLVGRDDHSLPRFTGKQRANLKDILKDAPETARQLPMILLDHQPHVLAEAENAGAALQLSGHTHHGQFWPINHIVKRMYENAYGHSIRGLTHYFVSQGTGYWGPPIRNTGRPEVLLFRIKFIKTGAE